MERAGGAVRIRSSAAGTEVHLHLDAPAGAPADVRPDTAASGVNPREESA
jgi:N-methylhydantoinase A/oxoprolinase/acetone carboxylase beta subunit